MNAHGPEQTILLPTSGLTPEEQLKVRSFDLAAWAALSNQGIFDRLEWTERQIGGRRHICLGNATEVIHCFDAAEFAAMSRDEILDTLRNVG